MKTEYSPFQIVDPIDVKRRITRGDTFVVNVVAAWCPDCTERQNLHFDSFAHKLKSHGIEVVQVNVQWTKGDFISAEHESMTTHFGGHGYPRTVLINHGNVEIISEEALSALAIKFIQRVQ